MPSGTQEQQRPAIEKPCRPILLTGVTVNPDKAAKASEPLPCCYLAYLLSLHRPSCPEPARGTVHMRLPGAKICRGAGKGGHICLFVCFIA